MVFSRAMSLAIMRLGEAHGRNRPAVTMSLIERSCARVVRTAQEARGPLPSERLASSASFSIATPSRKVIVLRINERRVVERRKAGTDHGARQQRMGHTAASVLSGKILGKIKSLDNSMASVLRREGSSAHRNTLSCGGTGGPLRSQFLPYWWSLRKSVLRWMPRIAAASPWS